MRRAIEPSDRPGPHGPLKAFRLLRKPPARFAYAAGEASNALNLLLVALIARWLGVEPYGHFIAILVTAQIFGQIAEFGFPLLVARTVAQHREKAWPEVEAALGRQVMLSVPALLALYAYLVAALDPALHVPGLLIGVSVCFQCLKGTLRGACRGLERFGTEALSLWAERAGLLGAGALTLAAGGELYGLGLVFFAVRGLDVVVFFAVVSRLFRPRRDGSGTEPMTLAKAAPFGVGAFLLLLYYQVDTAMIAVLSTTRDTGLYGALYRFVDVLHVLPRLIVTVAYPAMVVAWLSDRPRFQELLASLQRIVTLVAVPVLGVVLLWSEWLLRFVFGDGYVDGAPGLRLVVLGVYFAFYSALFSQALIAAGGERRLAAVLFGCVVLNMATNAVLIPVWGFMGAAAATLATEVVFAGALTLMLLQLDAPRTAQPRLAEGLGALLLVAIAAGSPGIPPLAAIAALVVFVSVTAAFVAALSRTDAR